MDGFTNSILAVEAIGGVQTFNLVEYDIERDVFGSELHEEAGLVSISWLMMWR